MWPRFKYILELNIHSVKECDPQKLGQIDVRPHYVSTELYVMTIFCLFFNNYTTCLFDMYYLIYLYLHRLPSWLGL